MNTKVVYYTKSGNTKKVADAIANEVGCEAQNLENSSAVSADVLFLGASVYKFGIDKAVLNFIAGLDSNAIGSAVIFSTSAMSDSGYPKLVKAFEARGIKVQEEHFYCKGEFMFANKNRPNTDDLASAKKFAKEIVAKI